jgi:hypothetical protein
MSAETRVAVLETFTRGCDEFDIRDALFRVFNTRARMEVFDRLIFGRMEFLRKFGGRNWSAEADD